ncbi:Na+/H+ antiporter NhaA [Pelagovum pacificum]|uniref:Na(+)/H(+) antiporter NhaA n=1 Tax=Pelagovum pacificum TaxID=2588711 RepID=A0A5C5G7L2_9RHOB|nr:Na+/H+ antiporter NhaA [Pelagovum pacificum]QQA41858.1 Na+/H+ antiporter NhaA [Pelagovum pacificum]TNY30699.1 Na+/H+ antiporter NhaA [Pelagovum pacificum]
MTTTTADVPNIDHSRDFWWGEEGASVSLIAYGDYTDGRTGKVRSVLSGDSGLRSAVCFVFRQRPRPGRPDAERAARAAIAAGRQDAFWKMHDRLCHPRQKFDQDSLEEAARELELDVERFVREMDDKETSDRLQADIDSASEANVMVTPALFIDGHHYLGPWDETSIEETIRRPLGVRLSEARQSFFNWAASGGFVLVLATLAALVVANIGYHDAYEALRETESGLVFGEGMFLLTFEEWINDGLMALFFLIVGIEIKREIVSGELSSPADAAMPVIGALGGMIVPALIYVTINFGQDTVHGWGIPMATDIAFTLGLMALLGRRVPSTLKVFVSALAIADDLGAILVIALFYGEGFHVMPFVWAVVVFGIMLGLGWVRVYGLAPYLILGAVLWVLIHESGLHATLAGVLTAAAIPSRPNANAAGVAAQAHAVIEAEAIRADREAEETGEGRFEFGNRALAIVTNAFERLREPGEHLQHALEGWTNYLILPLFAFFNTGLLIIGSEFSPFAPESLGVMLGLMIGKPLGIVGLCFIAAKIGLARLPNGVNWTQMIGAGCLAGVGFTMSIFIATAAFEGLELEAVKLAVLIGSTISAIAGLVILSLAPSKARSEPAKEQKPEVQGAA